VLFCDGYALLFFFVLFVIVMKKFSYIIYQGTDILPEIFSSSPHTRVFVARKLHEGASPRVILSDCKKKFLAIYICPEVHIFGRESPEKIFP
jgi:hypothetical protein